MSRIVSSLFALGIVVLLGNVSLAAPMYYATLAAFASDAGLAGIPLTLDDLNSGADNTLSPIPRGAYSITNPVPNEILLDATPSYGSGVAMRWTRSDGITTFSFTSPINAFGMDIFDLATGDGPTNFEFSVDNGLTWINVFGGPVSGGTGQQWFAGVIDAAATFSTVQVRNVTNNESDFLELDNIRFGALPPPPMGSGSEVPEPASAMAFAIAGLCAWASRRKRLP